MSETYAIKPLKWTRCNTMKAFGFNKGKREARYAK